MSEENKVKARRAYEEGWGEGRLEVFNEVYATDFVYHDPVDPEVCSREDYEQWVSAARIMWPDVHITIEEIFADGDKVVARGTMGGTHREGSIGGVPATGKKATWTWISIFHFAGGKIVELWNNYDSFGLLQQLGIITLPEGSEG